MLKDLREENEALQLKNKLALKHAQESRKIKVAAEKEAKLLRIDCNKKEELIDC